MRRVPPSDRKRDRIRSVLERGTEREPQSALVRLSMRLIVQEALEGNARDTFDRDRHARSDGEKKGYCNHQRKGSLMTAEGEVRHGVPQLRDSDGRSLHKLRERPKERIPALERLDLETYGPGCSTRNIEVISQSEPASAELRDLYPRLTLRLTPALLSPNEESKSAQATNQEAS